MMYNVTYSTRICDVCDIRAYLTWSDSPICKKIKCQFSAIIAQLYQSLPCTTFFNSNMSMQWRSMQSAKILFRRISKRRFVECRGARFHAVWLLSNEQLLQSLTNSCVISSETTQFEAYNVATGVALLSLHQTMFFALPPSINPTHFIPTPATRACRST
jgi:hypothetical protein